MQGGVNFGNVSRDSRLFSMKIGVVLNRKAPYEA
jgi:hypothetical protein